MRSRCVVSANFSGSSRLPGAMTATTSGAASMPRPLTTSTAAHRAPATWSRKSFRAAGSFFCLNSDSTGTKAEANEPSAKMRRR